LPDGSHAVRGHTRTTVHGGLRRGRPAATGPSADGATLRCWHRCTWADHSNPTVLASVSDTGRVPVRNAAHAVLPDTDRARRVVLHHLQLPPVAVLPCLRGHCLPGAKCVLPGISGGLRSRPARWWRTCRGHGAAERSDGLVQRGMQRRRLHGELLPHTLPVHPALPAVLEPAFCPAALRGPGRGAAAKFADVLQWSRR